MAHHKLDVYPEPQEKAALFVNEPRLIDISYDSLEQLPKDFDQTSDNVRIYVPLDLNADAILRRLRYLIYQYGEANEANESNFGADVRRLVEQIEIYDQVWFVRTRHHKTDDYGKITGHSDEAVKLVRDFIHELEEIPDGCAECFPFELIDELKAEYL